MLRAICAAALVLAACEKAPPRTPSRPTPDGKQVPPPDEDALVKRRAVVGMLARGPVLIHLDARRPGVEVPPKHRGDPALVLRIGRDLAPRIPDLVLGDARITATLSFDKKPFRCVIPWRAVYAALVEGDETGTVWRADVPPDAARE